MRFYRGAQAKVVSAFSALPLELMKNVIDKKQELKDQADAKYEVLKASMDADVLPVDQPRYLKMKQQFYNAVDQLSQANMTPEQSARMVIALNTDLRNEMTNGFIAQAQGNKKKMLEHREELYKRAKDLNLNDHEIKKFIDAGEAEFINAGGSYDEENNKFRNYEGLKPVKRTDYNKYGRDFAAAVKTGSIERVNQVLKDYGMYGKKIGNSSKFSGFSNKLELQQFLKSPESLRDAHVNAIMSNPEHLQALQQDVQLGYHRQYGRDWREVLYNMAGNSMQDLSHFDAQFGNSVDEVGMYDRRRQLDDRYDEKQKLNRVPMIDASVPLHELGVKLGKDPKVLSSVLNDALLDNPTTEHGKALKAQLNKEISTLFDLAKSGKISQNKADDEIQGLFKAFGFKGGTSRWTRVFGNLGVFDKDIESRQDIFKMFEPDESVLSENPESYARVFQAIQANNSLNEDQRVNFEGWGVENVGNNLVSAALSANKSLTAAGPSKFMENNKSLIESNLGLNENQSIGGIFHTNNGSFLQIKTQIPNLDDDKKVKDYTIEKTLIRLPNNNMLLDPTGGTINSIFSVPETTSEYNQYNQYTTPFKWKGEGVVESVFPTQKK